MNLLIVDDHPTNLKLLRAGLEAEGQHVTEAADGLQALQALEREPFDAVISDVLMPGMDGFRLCHELRRSEKLHKVALVLYTSTYNSAGDQQLAESVGADAYVLKPAPANELIQAVHDARERAQRRERAPPSIEHAEVLERYNAVLVRKLESRNAEVQCALANLRSAHEQILELNRNLEVRVAQRTAALDAANRELEAFSFSVSHDLRAPLRHISGFAELLLLDSGQQLSAEGRELAGRIVGASRQMNELIEALFEFARVGRVPLQLIDLDLNSVLKEALETVCVDALGRDIEWKHNGLPHALGDATLLRQVLINLLSNAIKYTRTRERAVIETGHRPGRSNEVVIFIKDNGVGFDQADAEELFGVFKRLHDAAEFEGTGIGLANVHRIVTRHGGSVWAEAKVNQGATFCFSLQRA
jgi:signal transduction histidine kinase